MADAKSNLWLSPKRNVGGQSGGGGWGSVAPSSALRLPGSGSPRAAASATPGGSAGSPGREPVQAGLCSSPWQRREPQTAARAGRPATVADACESSAAERRSSTAGPSPVRRASVRRVSPSAACPRGERQRSTMEQPVGRARAPGCAPSARLPRPPTAAAHARLRGAPAPRGLPGGARRGGAAGLGSGLQLRGGT